MNYKIWRKNNNSKYLQIEAVFSNLSEESQKVNLPAWRPGRYEIQNFAKFVRNVSAKTTNGQNLSIEK